MGHRDVLYPYNKGTAGQNELIREGQRLANQADTIGRAGESNLAHRNQLAQVLNQWRKMGGEYTDHIKTGEYDVLLMDGKYHATKDGQEKVFNTSRDLLDYVYGKPGAIKPENTSQNRGFEWEQSDKDELRQIKKMAVERNREANTDSSTPANIVSGSPGHRLGGSKDPSEKDELLGAKDFVKITDSGKIYNGGNQSWFMDSALYPDETVEINGVKYPTKLIDAGGCANSAAVNSMIYMGIVPFDGTKKGYQDIAEKMLQYFKPFIIDYFGKPGLESIIINKDELPPRETDYYLGATVGVPLLQTFVNGVQSFAQDQGIELMANVARRNTPYEEAIDFIKEGLDKDAPVSLLIGLNDEEPDYDMHWVTITGVEEDVETGDVTINVVSWGEQIDLPFDAVWNHSKWNKGLVYFENEQGD